MILAVLMSWIRPQAGPAGYRTIAAGGAAWWEMTDPAVFSLGSSMVNEKEIILMRLSGLVVFFFSLATETLMLSVISLM